jgi:hypothetical protein
MSFSWLHWGLMFGLLQFPDYKVRILLVGPFEFHQKRENAKEPGPASRLFWLWSPSRVFQFLIAKSPGSTAVGISFSLERTPDSYASLRLQFMATSVMFSWIPAQLNNPRETMTEHVKRKMAEEKLAKMIQKLMGVQGNNLDSILEELQGRAQGQAPPDFRGNPNLN